MHLYQVGFLDCRSAQRTLLCSDPFCALLYSALLCSPLLCSASLSPLPPSASPYLLFGSCAWPLSACVFVAQAM